MYEHEGVNIHGATKHTHKVHVTNGLLRVPEDVHTHTRARGFCARRVRQFPPLDRLFPRGGARVLPTPSGSVTVFGRQAEKRAALNASTVLLADVVVYSRGTRCRSRGTRRVDVVGICFPRFYFVSFFTFAEDSDQGFTRRA